MSDLQLSDTTNYTKVCKLSELIPNRGKRVFVGDVDIAIFLIEGEVRAFSNICPHQHSAILYDGFIEGNNVVCPAHGWEFDVCTGKKAGGSRGIKTFPVLIANSYVWINAEIKESSIF